MKKKILTTLSVVAAALTIIVSSVLPAGAFLVGDVADNDNAVTASDARLVLRASVGLEAFTEELKAVADTDEDGTLSASDARTILRMSVGLEEQKHFFTKEITLAPTCTAKGTMVLTCTECDEVIETELDALGHDFGEPEIIVAVTCETNGEEKYTCKREGCGHSEPRIVPAGHTPDIPAATCTQAQTCTRGNHPMAEALGHATDWGTCTQCNTFITTKYASQAETIKTKFAEAKAAFDTAYSINSYNAMIDGISWKVIPNTNAAKPDYLKAKAAYEAALEACGEIPELAAVKALLQKNVTNITAVLSQVDLILMEEFVDARNFEKLVWPLEELNDFNADSIRNTNKKLEKAILW